MSVEERIRSLVEQCGGRAPLDRVVREALGLGGATGPLARRLVEAALRDVPTLGIDGDAVVPRAAPTRGRLVALALAPAASATALPPAVAWVDVPDERRDPGVLAVATPEWRSAVATLARELVGAQVLALSATSARRLLRLGATLTGLDPTEEPEVVALTQVARRLGVPIRSAEDAARLVGSAVPETPEGSARLLALLALDLAARAGCEPAQLAELAVEDLAPAFDFAGKGFDAGDLALLPEAPGVYLFQDAEGGAVYVGKARNLRRRVASYFVAAADPRATRVRDAACELEHERCGTELSALLREQQLIRELRPAVNVQEEVHARDRSSVGHVAARGEVAVVQPSADGGAEVVLLDRRRGAIVTSVIPEAESRDIEAALRRAILELRARAEDAAAVADARVALTWLADGGGAASVVDASGDADEVASLLARLARDPDLEKGQVIPVR